MEAAKLVSNHKFGYNLGILPEDKNQCKCTIDTIIDQFQSNKLISYTPDMVEEFSFETQFVKLLEILR